MKETILFIMGFSISSGVFSKDRNVFFSQFDHAFTSAQSTEAPSGAGGSSVAQHPEEKKEIKCFPDTWNR